MSSQRPRRSRVARFALAITGLLLLAGAGGSVAFYLAFLKDLPDLQGVEDYRPPLASRVLDREGRPIGEFFVQRRRLTPYEDIPQHVVRAFVAGEDSAFFQHSGIDYESILRAAWVNLRAGGEIKQGASTITQQMVKGLLLSPERKFRRKIREMILARRIEQRFSKTEILYFYLNQIYFGHGAYGVGEAAFTYFGKPVGELSVSEAAMLAGLPKAPSRYSPFRNPEAAERRRRYVLGRMHEDHVIDSATYEEALAQPPTLVEDPRREDFAAAAYFTEEVRRLLFERLGGTAVLEGGLRIETTLDLELQKAAVAAVRKGLLDHDRRQGYRGPLRKVAAAEIPTELERIAEENRSHGEAPAEPEEPVVGEEAAAAGETPPAEEAAGAGQEGAEPADPAERALAAFGDAESLVGVVAEVHPRDQLARVGFAPGVFAWVRLEDVAWARPADPGQAPRPVERIDRVFHVGDVARFAPLDAPADPLPEGSPAHGQLLVTLVQEPIVQGALLSFDVRSGDVLAMVGGADFEKSQFNRVTQARRQPGSAFKPFVYGAALALADEEGHHRYTPASIIHDRPKVYEDRTSGFVWRPKNYGRKFYGPITLRKALAKSVNNASVHLADDIGVGAVIRYAKRLGVNSPLEHSLALALGTSGVSLLEITRAYAVFPAGGRRVVPRYIRRVTDPEGHVLLEDVPLGDPLSQPEPKPEGEATPSGNGDEETAVAAGAAAEPPADPDQLIPPEDAYLMADMLKAVVQEGTGRRLLKLGRPLAGKTGTTNDQADAWFVGFSPRIATGVWVGHDETRILGWGETGSRAAAPIWVDYMGKALANEPKRDFALPESIVFARIDRETGLLATSNTKEPLFQAFIAGTEPTETADSRRTNTRALQDIREESLDGGSMHLMKLDAY